MDSFQVYRDIKARTDGEIYLGVVGPVRTGKSTFIKRFADLLILPNLTDVHKKERTKDELPQSASGTTIMTTEPKFVPKEAVSVKLGEDVEVKIRLVDCVGYMVEGASGHIENGTERQVKTPWFEYEIPFTKAAAIGTQKVIHDHATIGLVVTTDGSVTELARENYIPAEEKTVRELQEIGKPFLIILNCQKPYAEEAKSLKEELQEKYQAPVIAMNCEQMKAEDLHEMMQQILYEFPVTEVEFYLPKWVEMLSRDHRIKQNLLENVKTVLDALGDIRSAVNLKIQPQGEYIDRMQVEKVEMDRHFPLRAFRVLRTGFAPNVPRHAGFLSRSPWRRSRPQSHAREYGLPDALHRRRATGEHGTGITGRGGRVLGRAAPDYIACPGHSQCRPCIARHSCRTGIGLAG